MNRIACQFICFDNATSTKKKAFMAYRAILLDESHKLDSWPLDEIDGIKSGKSKLNVHGTILEENQLV
jgi:hypothetical protein